MIERVFKIVAVVLAFAAIYLLWLDAHSDYAFAAIVLTVSATFLSYRFHIKDRMDRRAAEASQQDIPGE